MMYKFGEIWYSDPGIYDVKMCMTSIEYFTRISSAAFTTGYTARHCDNQ